LSSDESDFDFQDAIFFWMIWSSEAHKTYTLTAVF